MLSDAIARNIVSQSTQNAQAFVEIGEIVGVHGVQGWVKIKSFTRPRDNIKQYKVWQIRANKHANWQNTPILAVKSQGKGMIARLQDVNDREAAALLMGWQIAIHEQQLPNLQQDEYYWRDLIGLRVINHENINFGVVDHLIETGANDVLVVKDKTQERLIPFEQQHTIQQIDLDAGEIRVEWDADF